MRTLLDTELVSIVFNGRKYIVRSKIDAFAEASFSYEEDAFKYIGMAAPSVNNLLKHEQ
jgi:uncharacterized protein YlzI (FlbEa/FlbD family)